MLSGDPNPQSLGHGLSALVNSSLHDKGALLVRGLDKVISSNKEFSQMVELMGEEFGDTAGLATRKEFDDVPGVFEVGPVDPPDGLGVGDAIMDEEGPIAPPAMVQHCNTLGAKASAGDIDLPSTMVATPNGNVALWNFEDGKFSARSLAISSNFWRVIFPSFTYWRSSWC